jgi:hypothetical protein
MQRPISHETLRAFYELESVEELGSFHVASIDPDSSPLPNWMRAICPGKSFTFLSHQIRHLKMVLQTNKHIDADTVLFLDTTCWSTLLSMLLPKVRCRKILHLSMFHQQLANNGYFRTASFRLFRQLVRLGGSSVVLFECDDDCIQSQLRFEPGRKLVLPMPRSTTFRLKPKTRRNDQNRTLRVGLGGTIRPQKGTLDSEFLSAVIAGAAQSTLPVELVVGIPRSQGHGDRLPPDVEPVDTDDYDAYVAFIQSLDVLVVNLRRDHYWYRSSGVVQDALSAGVFVIVNDYPVVRSQISAPVTVGKVYSDLPELSTILANLRRHVRGDRRHRSETWNNARSPAETATALKRELETA